MKDLTEASDEEIAAEIERRERRRNAAMYDDQLREFVYTVCTEGESGTWGTHYKVFTVKMRKALGDSDYTLFLKYPERFVVDLTGAYIGSR